MGPFCKCSLARYALNRISLSPIIAKFVQDVVKFVDVFHFRNHVGDWCAKNVNPHRYYARNHLDVSSTKRKPTLTTFEKLRFPEIDGANTSVCEQAFRMRARLKVIMRGMNEQRFNLTLLMTTRLRQDWHDSGRSHSG